MLTTKPTQALDDLDSLDGGESATWRSVNLELWITYVFVTYSCKQDSISLSQTSILWIEEDILTFCRDLRDDRTRKITDFAVLVPDTATPGYSRRWVPIRELWSYDLPSAQISSPVYISVENERIGGPVAPTSKLTKKNAELLYRCRRRLYGRARPA